MRAEERKLGCWCLGWSRELPRTERWVCMWSGWGLCRRSHLTLLRMPLSLDSTVGKGVGAGGAPSSQAFSHYASSASQPLKWEVRIHRYPVSTYIVWQKTQGPNDGSVVGPALEEGPAELHLPESSWCGDDKRFCCSPTLWQVSILLCGEIYDPTAQPWSLGIAGMCLSQISFCHFYTLICLNIMWKDMWSVLEAATLCPWHLSPMVSFIF